MNDKTNSSSISISIYTLGWGLCRRTRERCDIIRQGGVQGSGKGGIQGSLDVAICVWYHTNYPHIFYKCRGYCYRLRPSVGPFVCYAVSSKTVGRNPTKFGVWVARTNALCKTRFVLLSNQILLLFTLQHSQFCKYFNKNLQMYANIDLHKTAWNGVDCLTPWFLLGERLN